MSSLFKYFQSRNEESAINKTLVYMQKILECVSEFEKGISFLLEERNIDLALKVFFRVNELEHQADGMRRDILNMLSKAELSNTIRENLIHLTQKIDDVANAANASARILIYINHSEFLKLDEEIHKKIIEMTRISIEAVKKLSKMVNSLLSAEESEIRDLGREVNILEHQCDEIHFAINRMLISNNPSVNPFLAIEIYNSISLIEVISDNAEDVADYIIMLILAKRP